MAFFDIPKDEDITPEARQWLDELQCVRGIEVPVPTWLACWRASDPQGPGHRRGQLVQPVFRPVCVFLGSPEHGDHARGPRPAM
jgi:hypothetical protein